MFCAPPCTVLVTLRPTLRSSGEEGLESPAAVDMLEEISQMLGQPSDARSGAY
jgi:hypothetical protein